MTSTSAPEAPSYLVGIDGSDQSRDALIWASRLAERTGATVDVVTAWRFPAVASLPLVGSPAPPMDVFADSARHRLDVTVDAAGVQPPNRSLIVAGGPGQVLIDLSPKYDLVVVGRTGRGRLERMLVGAPRRPPLRVPCRDRRWARPLRAGHGGRRRFRERSRWSAVGGVARRALPGILSLIHI